MQQPEQVAPEMRTGPRPIDRTPHLPEWQETAIRTVAVIALIYATYWITWRWTSTINPDPRALVPSLVLLVAETWAYLNMALFVFTTWRLSERNPGPPPEGRTVDVFITCYDEPLDVLRRTAIGARAIRYPHATYMLDDGKRDEVMAMALELGIGYIRRVGNTNAKSGNLNFAIEQTRGEFILQLDADHVPLPDIVDRLLGHFNDPRIAVVQSPQDFYNTDSFTHVVNEGGRRMWEENRIFYSLIQPGRDYWNASFFCGSCGMLRRSALESIGGFQSETIIEDMETTIRLQQAGWRSAYHRETLAYGLAPEAAGAYHVQRLRWGQGAMQVLRKLKPLTMPGLTLPQRIHYFAGTATYFEGWQKAIFYAMPLLYFYTGLMPVAVDETEFIARLIPYLLLSIAAFELLARGTGYLFISERYTMIRFFTYMLTVSALFSRKPLKFNVTPKGKSNVPFRTYAPQLTLLVLSVAAPVWATLAHHYGWIDYNSNGWGTFGFWVNGMWILWNCYFAAFVVRHCLAMRSQRDDHRFQDHLPVQVRTLDGADVPALAPALTCDLNPNGVGFRAPTRYDVGTRVSLHLPLSTGGVWVNAEVVRVQEEGTRYGEIFVHGASFTDLPIDLRDAIELHCTHHAVPNWHDRYRQSIDLLTRAGEFMRNARSERRRVVRLPARLSLDDEDGSSSHACLVLLDEISSRGARLISQDTIDPGQRVSFEVPGSALSGSGTVRFVRAIESHLAVRYAIGVEFDAAIAPARRLRRLAASALPNAGAA